MLGIDTKKDDIITIGENITIKVMRVGQGKVRIGIDAPKDIRIKREARVKKLEEEVQ